MDEAEPSFRSKSRQSADILSAKKAESVESGELFRGTLGLDFVFFFDGNIKKIKCVEINGEQAGIAGIQEVSRTSISYIQKVLARVRSHRRSEFDALAREPLSTDSLEHRKKELRHRKMHMHSYKNPEFIESITLDKSKQSAYIPPYLSPIIAHAASDLAACDQWVIKPSEGTQGENIYIMDARQIEDILYTMEADGYDPSLLFEENVVQEFIESLGADNADPSLINHPASLRLLVDFRYMHNGNIQTDYVAGYQRVSPYADPSLKETDPEIPGEEMGKTDFDIGLMEDIYVVNKARGASSAALSETEKLMALSAAKEIIQRLGEAYRIHKQTEDTAG